MEAVTPSNYRIEIEPSAWKELMNVNEKLREKIFDAIYALEQDPRPSGCRKLKGSTGFFRIRIGDYRVIYDVQDGKLVVVVFAVGDRKEIYG